MDFWMLMSRLIAIFYTAFLFVSADRPYTPYAVLFLLLYLSLGIAVCMIRPPAWRRGVTLMALALTAWLSALGHPAFLFLLPPAIFAVLAEYPVHRYVFCLLVFLPFLFIPYGDLPTYIVMTLFCLAIFVLAARSSGRLKKYEEQSDNMRSSIEKLTKQLHSSTEYIKQSEYTGKLEERNRLSQAIHDKIGHSMTGALIQMEAAKRMLGSHPDKSG